MTASNTNDLDANREKQQERDRRRAAGQVLVQEWVHRDDAKALREFANSAREKSKELGITQK